MSRGDLGTLDENGMDHSRSNRPAYHLLSWSASEGARLRRVPLLESRRGAFNSIHRRGQSFASGDQTRQQLQDNPACDLRQMPWGRENLAGLPSLSSLSQRTFVAKTGEKAANLHPE